MNNKLLLPHKFKIIGWIILALAMVIGLAPLCLSNDIAGIKANVFSIFPTIAIAGKNSDRWFSIINVDITLTLICALFIIGAFFVGFAKTKKEDEFISSLRLNALSWAVVVNYALLFIAVLFVYGLVFLNVLMFNMFTIFIIFILRFHYLLYKYSKKEPLEK
jgi:hypothetical protein